MRVSHICHTYTDKQIEFIKKHVKNMTWKELALKFNKTYKTNIRHRTLAQAASRRGIKTGRTGCFKKGQTPWNKGMKGVSFPGMEATQFKKGNKPPQWVPVGTEIINSHGYAKVKIGNPGKWRLKHHLIWEKHNNKAIPRGHVVIFGDGNKKNLDPNNLILVTKAQLVRMNQHGLIRDDADLTRSGVIIADIKNKIGERKRIMRNEQKS